MSSTVWGKFYWSDWRSDPALRSCSFAARGLWIDLLAIMAEADGYLLINEKAPSTAQLARVLGGSVEEVEAALAELDEAGVFSRDRRGVIYSRRMVRDEKRASKSRENGKLGGNPSLRKDGGNPAWDKGQVIELDKARAGNNQKPDTRDQSSDSSEPPKKTHPQQSAGAPRAGSRLPADWRPDEELRQYAKAQGFDERTIDRIAEDFRDYWVAQAGARGVKADWPATWRTWCRKERDRRPQPPKRQSWT